MIVFLFLITTANAFSQAVPEYMYYKFDAAGNQQNYASAPVGTNPAILTGLTVGSTGQFGTALIGNGLASGTNSLNTGWATNLPATGWTISFWLNNFPSTAATTYYYFGDATAGTFRCFTGGVAGNGNLWLRGTGLTDVPINAIPATPTVIHLVYTGSAVRVFFNGVFNSSVAQAAVTLSGAGPFLVGGYSTSNSFSAGTLMDEFRLYNRALSDGEVAATWNQPLPVVTAGPPVAVTTAATAITSTGATLNGTINANGASTTVTFEYGLTTAYGTVVSGVPATVTGNTVTPVSVVITGLLPGNLYHYRVCGVNSYGSNCGTDMTFTTSAILPAVTTTAATGVTSTGATLNGTVNAGGASTTVSFEYGLTVAYGTTVPGIPSPVTGNIPTPVSATITGLTINTTYHYRVKGVNSVGTTNGTDMTFTTFATPPTVTTNAASGITTNSATLNGSVNANSYSTTVSFDWGLTIAYGSNIAATPSPVTGNTPTAVSANLTGLVNNTTYHYRCIGVNLGGTTYGTDMTFLSGCPAVGPAGSITGSSSVCANAAGVVYSIASIANATGYAWSVPAGAVITAGNNTTSITVTFGTTSGNVSVYGTGSCGNGLASNFPVTVNPLPVPTISGPATACQGTVNNTYTTQTGMSGYNWAVSAGGTITAGSGTSSITVTWTTTGAKTVSVTYTNANNCTAATPTVYNVTVNPAPVPTITGQNVMCVNSGYYNYTTESGFSNYTWNISAGGTITWGQGTNQVQVTWNQPGAQTISVNYTNGNGCTAITPTLISITVNPLPGAAGTITGTVTVCGGAQGITYSVASVTNAVTYVWTLPAGATIASGALTNSITVNFAANASSGNITVFGNNLCGNGGSSPPFAVTVTQLPVAAGMISGDDSVCEFEQGIVYSVPVIANATGYVWTLPDGAFISSGMNTNSITVDFWTAYAPGIITVKGTNSCGVGTISPDFHVMIGPMLPAPFITVVDDISIVSNSTAGNQWYYGSTLIPGETGQTLFPQYSGWYYDIVSINGCSSPTSNHVYFIVEGTNNKAFTGKVVIYPNPGTGKFTLQIQTLQLERFDLTILNGLGLPIYQQNEIQVNDILEKVIDLRPVPEGVYWVELKNDHQKIIKKIIIR